jgi:hypothetical protein
MNSTEECISIPQDVYDQVTFQFLNTAHPDLPSTWWADSQSVKYFILYVS